MGGLVTSFCPFNTIHGISVVLLLAFTVLPLLLHFLLIIPLQFFFFNAILYFPNILEQKFSSKSSQAKIFLLFPFNFFWVITRKCFHLSLSSLLPFCVFLIFFLYFFNNSYILYLFRMNFEYMYFFQ